MNVLKLTPEESMAYNKAWNNFLNAKSWLETQERLQPYLSRMSFVSIYPYPYINCWWTQSNGGKALVWVFSLN